MDLTLITAPSAEPIDATDVDGPLKRTLRITGSSEDPHLLTLAVSARQLIENFTRRAMIDQVWEQYHDRWPADGFRLFRGRVRQGNLTSITYVNEADVSSTVDLSTTDFAYWEDPLPSITLKSGKTWPTATLRPKNGIIIRFTAGYGTTASTVPDDLKRSVVMAAVALYDGCMDEQKGPWRTALDLASMYQVSRSY